MTLAERLRQKFVDAKFEVSGRDDVSLAAFAWYVGKRTKTISNTLRVPGKWPRSELVGGSRRFTLDAILQWELRRLNKAA